MASWGRPLASPGWHACTILVSAFLLFQVEPLIAKLILPWFGGSAAVWTTCLVFFQLTLLLAYLYAHGSLRLPPRTQGRVHAGLLLASLAFLPVLPGSRWQPRGASPTLEILGLLAATVGPPFFMLATTGPLVQAWAVRRHPGAAPWRLYALSNTGSLLALLSYPVLVEPHLATRSQARGWSLGYALFVLLAAGAALAPPGPARAGEAPEAAPGPPPWRVRLAWAALPACASALLLAVSNHLSQNVAAIPFLWVLPLSLYLLSFILCFDREGCYRRAWWLAALAPALGGMAYSLLDFENLGVKPMIALFSAGLFLACMVCHGELVRLKPHPRHLTGFYLMVALGGAAGGLVVAVLAPNLCAGDYELPAILAACVLLAAGLALAARPGAWAGGLCAVAAAAVLVTLGMGVRASLQGCRVRVRNFYGSLRIQDYRQGGADLRVLYHGVIDHGEQYLAPDRSRQPTTYYGPDTGVGRALRSLDHPGRRLGFVGLGAGTLAAYGAAGDECRFYELNPLILELARTEFRYLRETPARVTWALGDARLSLEREPPQQFDLLAVDAFSSDAIPVHLLTLEAFELYFRHLKADGILAVHISNRYLDLDPVVEAAARALGKATLVVDTDEDEAHDLCETTWVLVAGRPDRFRGGPFRGAGPAGAPRPGFRAWTDDYSNLFTVLR